jgi:phosphoribosylformylglycinamidine cyclo-ligase
VAFLAGRHDTIGIDLVAMSVNDIIVQGARPLFFLDYLAMARIDLDMVEQIIRGIVAGCKEAHCSLIGGETAEMPDFYKEGEYDLAGFAVGLVDNDRIIDGSTIHVGNRIIGLASSGLHSNGFSLARRIIFDQLQLRAESFNDECGRTVADELLQPTRIYVDSVLRLLRQYRIAGMAHITGGGFYDNVARILPKTCQAAITEGSWETPPIFDFLREKGNVSRDEMYRVFNNGIGYVLVVDAGIAGEVIEHLAALGQKAYTIGDIVPKAPEAPPVQVLGAR